MARFASLTDQDLDTIIDGKDSKNTKSVIRVSERILSDYLIEKAGDFKSIDELDSSEVNVDTLNTILRKFYGEVRKADGTRYAKKSMITLRFGLQKHFLKSKNEDVINSDAFSGANEMLKAVLVKLSKDGHGTVRHKDVIIREDLQKLYNHPKFSCDTPESLQKRVFFEYLFYFCNRGRENLRDVKKDDFELCRDGQGMKYVSVKVQRQTKNHRGDNLTDNSSKDGRMYEIPGNQNCPVTSFTKYLSKLNPGNHNFFQRPKPKEYISPESEIWYDNVAVGKNTIGSMMSNLSDECGLSKRYTNHCIRSTSITALDDGGIETRHIMGLSGHKSESAVRSYTTKLSEKKTREMSSVLSSTVCSATSEAIVNQQPTITSNSVSNVASGPVSNVPPVLPDFLSDDYELVNTLNDILVTNFEANNNQLPVQNNVQNFTNAPTCNFSGFPSGISINNSTVNFYFKK